MVAWDGLWAPDARDAQSVLDEWAGRLDDQRVGAPAEATAADEQPIVVRYDAW
jgi:hypothetical protein